MSKKRGFENVRLTLQFAGIVFFIMLLTLLLILGGAALLGHWGLLSLEILGRIPIFYLVLVSLIISTVLAVPFGRRSIKPLGEIMAAADTIAEGDYSVRVVPSGTGEIRKLGEKFNHMAAELGSVEMLRTDFINNFSHEFKTPLVSMSGLAKVLKRNDLTEEERDKYLDLIIEETERLTSLASGVLNLSKIERQSIISDKSKFNLTEQLRLIVAMLDSRWSEKQLEIDFDCEEIEISGNAEMLREVWINLLDNAIKFSPEHGTVKIKAADVGDKAEIIISNQCEHISKETLDRIFEKFYQGDTSHAVKGNGLGLSIVKRIVELHGGTISAIMCDEQHISLLTCLEK